MANSFSFYFNYNYGLNSNVSSDKFISINHTINTFYKQKIGKIINITEMLSDYGCFFIITFNKETWNWNNSLSKKLYNSGFNSNEILKHKMLNEYPITFENNGVERQIILTTFPNFYIENIQNHSDLIGEYMYNITWNNKGYSQTTNVFNINKQTILNNDNNNSDKNLWNNCSEHDNSPFDEKKFYEDWANELDNLYDYDNAFDDKWKPIEYRYDLSDMIFNGKPKKNNCEYQLDCGVIADNGYVVFNKLEFIDYYGEDEGTMRWNSDIYSAKCFTEGDITILEPPIGCQINYNMAFLFVKICLELDNENDFNIKRTIIRKYVDVLWSLTDASDDNYEEKPCIKLRADYNNEKFYISCWYNFQYTNLKGEKLFNLQKIINNFKSYDFNNMIDWFPFTQ